MESGEHELVESSVESVEKEYKTTLRFDRLSEEEFQALEKHVEESKGVVRIFVHPSHMIGNKEMEAKKFESHGREMSESEKPFFIMVETARHQSAPPIIILQNHDRLAILRDYFENINSNWEKFPHPFYVLPTLKNYPYPKLDDLPEPERGIDGHLQDKKEDFSYCALGMTRLVQTLEKAKIKKVLLGGAELRIESDRLKYCVGNFINFFRALSETELKVSSGTIPEGRKELREKGFDELL